MKKVIVFLLVIVAAGFSAAQTYCYRYLYNITEDGVKKTGAVLTTQFYFTFNSDRSGIHQTDKNGYYSRSRGNGEYR